MPLSTKGKVIISFPSGLLGYKHCNPNRHVCQSLYQYLNIKYKQFKTQGETMQYVPKEKFTHV